MNGIYCIWCCTVLCCSICYFVNGSSCCARFCGCDKSEKKEGGDNLTGEIVGKEQGENSDKVFSKEDYEYKVKTILQSLKKREEWSLKKSMSLVDRKKKTEEISVDDFYLFFEPHDPLFQDMEFYFSGNKSKDIRTRAFYDIMKAKVAQQTGGKKILFFEVFVQGDPQLKLSEISNVFETLGKVWEKYKDNDDGVLYLSYVALTAELIEKHYDGDVSKED